MGRFRGSIALKVAFLGLSLPLLLGSNAWASGCSEAEIRSNLEALSGISDITRCGAEAVPALVAALKDDADAGVRSYADEALGEIS